MKGLFTILMVAGLMTSRVSADDRPELILDESILERSAIASNLSSLAYMPANATSGETLFVDPRYGNLTFYTEEPNQALIANIQGWCYLAFRGTDIEIDQWISNLRLDTQEIYRNNDIFSREATCTARAGFA